MIKINTLIVFMLFAYMIDGGKQRWHKCKFPHSWDWKIEHIIDKKEAYYYYS